MNIQLKSYLVQAVYDYCIHHGHDPHVVVATGGNSDLPPNTFGDATITLNLSNNAIRNFRIEQEKIHFSARFSGKVHQLTLDVGEIVWIGAPSADAGIGFQPVTSKQSNNFSTTSKPSADKAHSISNANLRLIK